MSSGRSLPQINLGVQGGENPGGFLQVLLTRTRDMPATIQYLDYWSTAAVPKSIRGSIPAFPQSFELSSSTEDLPEDQEKDPFGIILSYSIKVKLILGALGGEVVSELPFVLMNSGNGKMLVGENTTLMGNRELSSETTQPLNKKEA
ncbi:arrestin-like protein [Trichonephila clavipes]|nr:arrestin-like protein [Trichonephila clavipes]